MRGALTDLLRVKSQHPNIKTLLSIGGGGDASNNFPEVVANTDAVDRFTSSAKQLIEKYDLDGIDSRCEAQRPSTSSNNKPVDWEHPKNLAQGRDYNNLLSALRKALPRSLLSSALPCEEDVLKNIDVCQSAQYLNFINLMAYDFSGPWTKLCGHQAQLFSPKTPYSDAAKTSCDSAVTYLLAQGVSPVNILLGVPAYGRSFHGAQKVGDTYQGGAGDEGTFEYRDLPRQGAKVSFDDKCGATYAVGGDAGFVSYDDPRVVSWKARYVKQKGLVGLFYWTGTGDTNDDRSLVATGWKTLRE